MAQTQLVQRSTMPTRSSRLQSSRSAQPGGVGSPGTGVPQPLVSRAPSVQQGVYDMDGGPFAATAESSSAAAASSTYGGLPHASSFSNLVSGISSPGTTSSVTGYRKLVPTISGPARAVQQQQQPRSVSHPRSAGRPAAAASGWGAAPGNGNLGPALTGVSGRTQAAGGSGPTAAGPASAGPGSAAAGSPGQQGAPRLLRPSSSRRGASGSMMSAGASAALMGNSVFESFGAASLMSGLIQNMYRPRTSPEPGYLAHAAASAHASGAHTASGGLTGGSAAQTPPSGTVHPGPGSGPASTSGYERMSPRSWGSGVRPSSASPPGSSGASGPGSAQHPPSVSPSISGGPQSRRPLSAQQGLAAGRPGQAPASPLSNSGGPASPAQLDLTQGGRPGSPALSSGTPMLPRVGSAYGHSAPRRTGSGTAVPVDGLPAGPSRLYEAIARQMGDMDEELAVADLEELYSSGLDEASERCRGGDVDSGEVDMGGGRRLSAEASQQHTRQQNHNQPRHDKTQQPQQTQQQEEHGEQAPAPEQQQSLQEQQLRAFSKSQLDPKPPELQLRALSFDSPPSLPLPATSSHPPNSYSPLQPSVRGRMSWTGHPPSAGASGPASSTTTTTTCPPRAASPPLIPLATGAPGHSSRALTPPPPTPTAPPSYRFPALALPPHVQALLGPQQLPHGQAAGAGLRDPVSAVPPAVAAAVADIRQLLCVSPGPAPRSGSFTEELTAGAVAGHSGSGSGSGGGAPQPLPQPYHPAHLNYQPQPLPQSHLQQQQLQQQQQRLGVGSATAASAAAIAGRPYVMNKLRLNLGVASSAKRPSEPEMAAVGPLGTGHLLPSSPASSGGGSLPPFAEPSAGPREVAGYALTHGAVYAALTGSYEPVGGLNGASSVAPQQQRAVTPSPLQPPQQQQQQQQPQQQVPHQQHTVQQPLQHQRQQQQALAPAAQQHQNQQQQHPFQQQQWLLQRQLQQQQYLLQQMQQAPLPDQPQLRAQHLQQQQQLLLQQKQQLGRIVSLATAMAAGGDVPDCLASASAVGPPLDWDLTDPAHPPSPRRLLMQAWRGGAGEQPNGDTGSNRPSTARNSDRSGPSPAGSGRPRAAVGGGGGGGGALRQAIWMEGSSQLLAASQQHSKPQLWVHNTLRPISEAPLWLARAADSAPSSWGAEVWSLQPDAASSRGYLEGLRCGTCAVEAAVEAEEAQQQRLAALAREPQVSSSVTAKVQTWRPREPPRRPRTRSAGPRSRRGDDTSSDDSSGGEESEKDADDDGEEGGVGTRYKLGTAGRGRPRPRPPDIPRPPPATLRKPRPQVQARGAVRAKSRPPLDSGDEDE